MTKEKRPQFLVSSLERFLLGLSESRKKGICIGGSTHRNQISSMGYRPKNEYIQHIICKKNCKPQVSTFTFKKSFPINYVILEEERHIWDFTSSNYLCHSSGMNTNEEPLDTAIK